MIVYDTANKLAKELKESEEFINYKAAKQAINSNTELKKKIDEFEKARYEEQLTSMQTGKPNEEQFKKIQEMYADLMKNEEATKFFEAELKFNIILGDVNKIIGDAVKDVLL